MYNAIHKKDINVSVIRCPELLIKLQISRSTLWRWEKNQSDFPKRIRMGQRSVGWILAEVEAWIASRERVGQISESNGGGQDE